MNETCFLFRVFLFLFNFMMDELREFVEYNYNYNELGNDIFLKVICILQDVNYLQEISFFSEREL